MDLVTQNLMSAFRDEEALPKSLDESEVFEHFVNFCTVSSEYGEEFDVEEVHTGGGDDLGLDGIAVVVNGALVFDVDEVDDLAVANKFLEVEFIFCQAKSGGSFTGSEISSFFFGVKDIFSANPALPRNERVSDKEALIRAIYKKSTLFKRGNPLVRMYYATTGKWQEDAKLVSRINHEREALLESDIFRDVDFTPVDARQLQAFTAAPKTDSQNPSNSQIR